MNRTALMIKIVEMASLGGAMPADEAVSYLSAMLDRLDPDSATYDHDAALLLGIGATIWKLEQARLAHP